MEPRSFEEMPQAIQALRERKSVVLNLTIMDPDQAQRAVDFVAGGTYAIDGHQERIGESIFLFTPNCVQDQHPCRVRRRATPGSAPNHACPLARCLRLPPGETTKSLVWPSAVAFLSSFIIHYVTNHGSAKSVGVCGQLVCVMVPNLCHNGHFVASRSAMAAATLGVIGGGVMGEALLSRLIESGRFW